MAEVSGNNPGANPPGVDGREAIAVTAPAPEADNQPGFKVLEEAPQRSVSKGIWTAVVVLIAILAGAYFGYFR